MKKQVTKKKTSLDELLGERILVLCVNYFYTGILKEVHENHILLDDAYLVYETGSFIEKGYKDAQKLPGDNWYVQRNNIESFGKSK